MRICLAISLIAIPLFAAFESPLTEASITGTAESSVASRQIYASYLRNPAISSQVNHAHFSLFFTQPYGMPDLRTGSFITHFRLKKYGFGLSTVLLGNEIYRETQVIGNLSRSFYNEQFSFGLNIRWYNLQVDGYGSMNVAGVDAGIQYQLHNGILMGFALRNVNQPGIAGQAEQLPSIIQLGMSFQLTNRVDTYLSVQKDSWYPLSVRFGVSMLINSYFQFQTGFNSSPSVPSMGMSLNRHWISVQYGFRYHFDLGGTHVWGLSFEY
jgi:hypothetical protein